MPNPDDLMKRLNNVLDGPDAGLGLHSILAECRDRILDLTAQNFYMRTDMLWFCQRVEAGEVLSKATYERFNETLERKIEKTATREDAPDRICLNCDHFIPDEFEMLPPHQRDGECSKINYEDIQLRVDCGSWCQGGTPKLESVNASFGCIRWSARASESLAGED